MHVARSPEFEKKEVRSGVVEETENEEICIFVRPWGLEKLVLHSYYLSE